MLVIGIILVVLLAFLIWASAYIGSNVYVKAICANQTEDKVVYLTFDDGPDPNMTPKVLEILEKYNVKASFFLIGEKAENNADLVKLIHDSGHSIGNHTYSHSSMFPLFSKQNAKRDIEKCNSVIANIIQEKVNYFRPPFGVTNPTIRYAINSSKLKTIGWSIRTFDTVESVNREKIIKKVTKNLKPGAIILLHDRCSQANLLLEKIILAILDKGYNFATIDNLNQL